MKDRVILHCDMNNCYASIECLLDPSLKGKAMAVCGSPENRHGIILAKSEEAKKFGVKTAETIWQAKAKCPNLVLVPPHHDIYWEYSRRAYQLYSEYTDRVESFGVDECWLDVTASQKLFGSGVEIAEQIRKRMKAEIGLTVSVGVSFNKVFAKLGSDMKKPDAVTEISRADFKVKLAQVPVGDMLGVGPATARRLEQNRIRTISELAAADPVYLEALFGVHGRDMWRYANGLDDSPVLRYDEKPPIKSVGRGLTVSKDLKTEEEVKSLFFSLAQDVGRRLRNKQFFAGGVQIVIRDNEFHDRQVQGKLEIPTQNAAELSARAMELFRSQYTWHKPIRMLTLRAIDLVDGDTPYQFGLFTDVVSHEKQSKVEDTLFDLKKRYGEKSLNFASLLGDKQQLTSDEDEE